MTNEERYRDGYILTESGMSLAARVVDEEDAAWREASIVDPTP